jgi:His/Glu/Gln/Arg/opine family amino acid ABC transporter permease subunit
MSFEFLSTYGQYFINGTAYTVGLSLMAVLFGLIVGTLLTLVRRSKIRPLAKLGDAYVAIVRGTPLILQLYIVYYGLQNMPMLVAAVLAMTFNSAAYISEIIRAGIEAVDKGQWEAARSLGMSSGLTMKNVILPQAFKNILPALGNEFIVLIKESAIVSVIGVHDLMYNADTVRGITFKPFEPLIVVASIYFVLTYSLSKALQQLEGRLKVSD